MYNECVLRLKHIWMKHSTSLHTFTDTTYISFFIQFAHSKDLFPGGHVAQSFQA